jgi:hypothetical protein
MYIFVKRAAAIQGFLPSTHLLTPQQFQKDTPTKNEIKTPNQ